MLFLLATLLFGAEQQPLLRSIEIWSENPIAVQIEFLTIDQAGKETITARHKRAVGPPVPLEFEHGFDRYVRFSYEGAAPRTYSTAALLGAKRLHVPDVLPGGELLLFLPDMTVRPAELRLEGPRVQTLRLSGEPYVSLSGMPPGEYRITTHYEGGQKGATRTAMVANARTTLGLLAPEALGAVEIVAAPEICSSATNMSVAQLVTADVAPHLRTGPNSVRVSHSTEPRCHVLLAGLKPGSFETAYFKGTTAIGRAGFVVEPQTIARVIVAERAVKLEGAVTMNGKPIRQARIAIRPVDRAEHAAASSSAMAPVENGRYSLGLDTPGRYAMTITVPQTGFVHNQTIVLTQGHNTHDIALRGGSITIVARGWDAGSQLQIRIQGRSGNVMTAVFHGHSGEHPTYEGLPYGEYRVGVATGAAIRSAELSSYQTVVLTAASPEATLTFNVRR